METLLLSPTEENLALAARALREGQLVGMPTETVYGLGADALNEEAKAAMQEVDFYGFCLNISNHGGGSRFFDELKSGGMGCTSGPFIKAFHLTCGKPAANKGQAPFKTLYPHFKRRGRGHSADLYTPLAFAL